MIVVANNDPIAASTQGHRDAKARNQAAEQVEIAFGGLGRKEAIGENSSGEFFRWHRPENPEQSVWGRDLEVSRGGCPRAKRSSLDEPSAPGAADDRWHGVRAALARRGGPIPAERSRLRKVSRLCERSSCSVSFSQRWRSLHPA
jgi:hypothetical protein